MVCHRCQAAGNQSEAAYSRQITGEGPTYREQLKRQVSCRTCGEMMSAGYLASYLMTQHGRLTEVRQSWITLDVGAGPRTFRIAFPAKGGPRSCPVEGCPGRAAMKTMMRVHLLHRHFLDTVVILEEVNPPPPTMYPMQHAGPPVGPEQQATCHSPVRQGNGAEDAEARGGGDEGELGKGI